MGSISSFNAQQAPLFSGIRRKNREEQPPEQTEEQPAVVDTGAEEGNQGSETENAETRRRLSRTQKALAIGASVLTLGAGGAAACVIADDSGNGTDTPPVDQPGDPGDPGEPPIDPPDQPPGPTAEELLSAGPFEPSNNELYLPFIYPSDLEMVDAEDPGWTDEERVENITSQLQGYIETLPEDKREQALEVFEQAGEIMDIRLAAGLAMLVNTAGEPAIEPLLNGDIFEEIVIGGIQNPDNVFESQVIPGSSKRRLVLNEKYAHEDFRFFAPFLVHEALHSDARNGRPEEAANHLIQFLILGELLAEHPDMLESKTGLARGQATMLLGVLFNSNSVMEGRGETIFPDGDIPVSDFYNEGPIQIYPDIPSSGSQLLVDILGEMGLEQEDIPDYTKALLEQLDIDELIDLPGGLDPDELQRVAEALTIDLPA